MSAASIFRKGDGVTLAGVVELVSGDMVYVRVSGAVGTVYCLPEDLKLTEPKFAHGDPVWIDDELMLGPVAGTVLAHVGAHVWVERVGDPVPRTYHRDRLRRREEGEQLPPPIPVPDAAEIARAALAEAEEGEA